MNENFIILKQQISNLPYSLDIEAKPSLKNYMNFLFKHLIKLG